MSDQRNPKRLEAQPAEWIDRAKPIRFTFEGRPCTGFSGDTISSALHANGVLMMGRSFKYHRPRGVYSMANHDANCIFEDGRDTNIRGDVTPIYEGASYRAVNTFGGLAGDRLKIMDAFSAFLPVGFYYKTFHRPRLMFPFWERQIRKAAGLGSIDPKAPMAKTPKRYDWRDVLVVGAGPAGLSAAIAAAQAGASVLVVDDDPHPGGSLTYQFAGDPQAAKLLGDLLQQAAALPNLEIRTGTLAAGYYADHWIALVDNKKLTKLRARSVVFAQGAFEQPAVFRHNDLPGVMLASAAQRLISRFGVKPFDTGVVLTANAEGYRVALDLKRVGIGVAAVVDLRPQGEPGALGQGVAQAGIPILPGQAIHEASPRGGKIGIQGVVVCPLTPQGDLNDAQRRVIACDGVAMSVGWSGANGLLYQSGARMMYSEPLAQFVPNEGSLPPGIFAAGRVNGVYDLQGRLADGSRAGAAAAVYLGFKAHAVTAQRVERGPANTHAFPIFAHPSGKAFIDLDEDVQFKDIVNAAAEGFDNIELLKRYSTFGMGPSQGKIANTNAMRALARVRQRSVPEVGMPTSRPFWNPVEMKMLGGRGFHPHRLTPIHPRHAHAGAVFMAAGEWLRPAYYAVGDQTKEALIREEVLAVRNHVGIIDVGTLGKIEVSGPDAGEFLERVYTARFKNMKPGTTRYGLMCDETGVVIDDGVIGKLADDRYYITTTTSASGPVYREMQRYVMTWGLDVVLVNATGLYGGMNVAGPKARQLLAPLTNLDLSDSAFPYLGLRQGNILGVPARFMRVGFVGELGYEVHLPAYYAAQVWDAMMHAGESLKIRQFGVEAQRILRLEKAHLIVSQDTDGLTHPYEAGLDWAIKDDKGFFIGQRSLRIIKKKPLTRKLVGFTLPPGYQGPLPKDCHLVIDGSDITGRVTSIAVSPAMGFPVGMAYVSPEKATPGSTIQIRIDGGQMVTATVAATPFYDPKGERQKVS